MYWRKHDDQIAKEKLIIEKNVTGTKNVTFKLE